MAYHLVESPSSVSARQLLKGLLPIKEKRKGKISNVYIIAFFYLPIVFFVPFYLLVMLKNYTHNDILLAVLFFSNFAFSAIFLFKMISREFSFISYNQYDQVVEFITPLLNDGECFLTYSLQKRSTELAPPQWLAYHFGDCIVFTSDRILILNLAVGPFNANNRLQDFKSCVSDIYTVDMLDPEAFCLQGFVSIFLWYGFRNLTLAPIGQEEIAAWLLQRHKSRHN